MLIDPSKEAENDKLSDGYSLDAPSGALRAPFFLSVTWSWKLAIMLTPNQSSTSFLLRDNRSVITLRCWNQHQELEKNVSFSEMYRFTSLLGLEHSLDQQTATRVGRNCLF